ncbi:transmembrane emp24 domain-containing protein p24delta3-like [Fagus crenata]
MSIVKRCTPLKVDVRLQKWMYACAVTSPYGNNLHHKDNATHGQFAFTTHEAGNYLACFWVDGHNPGGGDVSVNLDWRTGIAAKRLGISCKKRED